MKKKVVSVLLATAMVLGLTACGSGDMPAAPAASEVADSGEQTEEAPAEEAPAAEATETNGDTNILRINLASEPDYLDPALNSSVDGGCLAVNSFAGLYTYDESGALVPDLATDMPEISADGTTYTVKLIDSVWSNGDPLTAQDFVYSWNRVIDEKTAADYAYLFDVFVAKSDGTLAIDTPDDHTLVMQLQSPCPYFNDLLAFPTFFPVHQASVEAANPDGDVPGKWAQEAGFVCNGAYMLQEWNHDESMVYVKNPNYHAADTVTMDELHFMLSADDTAIYAAYNSGDVDYIDTLPNDEIASLNGINPEFGILPQLGTYYVCFNVNDPMFDGKTEEEAANMRKAMGLLIDRQFIVDNIGQTGQIPADAFIPAGMSDGNGGEFKANVSYYDATKTGADMVEDAKALLESAGYSFTDNGDGTYAIDPAINMTYLTNDGTGHIKIAESIQHDFDALGIKIEIKSEDWNVFLEDRKEGKFTVAREGWVADYNDPINMLEIFASESGNNDAQLGKGTPVSSSPKWDEYDKMIDEIRYETDLAKRVETMHKAEDMLMDTGAILPIYYYNDVYMQKSNVSGIYATVFGMKYFMHATKN